VETLIATAVLFAILAFAIFATRKKPGRRYDKKPPGRGDAHLDQWWGPG
jgi:hypothetical protein